MSNKAENDKLVEILAEPVTCEDGKSHYIDESNRRYLASNIRATVAEEIIKDLEITWEVNRYDPYQLDILKKKYCATPGKDIKEG